MSVRFSRENRLGKILLHWWKGLDDDRAARASLRRAGSITAITLTASYQRIFRVLCEAGWDATSAHRNDRLAALIGLLASLKGDNNLTPIEAMSTPRERPCVSELRFLRLLDSTEIDSLFTGLRRVLPLMENKVDIIALANDVIFWGDKVKKNWAYGYSWPK